MEVQRATGELRRKLSYLFVSLAVLVADQWSKWLVEAKLPHGVTQEVIPGFFNLTHVKNSGVAFGLFAAHGAAGGAWFLVLMGMLALAAVVIYFRLTPLSNRVLLTALSLIVGGAVGNLFDRVGSGAVTDFVDVYVGSHHWPAFNVADSAITIGICLMIFDSFRSHRSERAEPAETPTTEASAPAEP